MRWRIVGSIGILRVGDRSDAEQAGLSAECAGGRTERRQRQHDRPLRIAFPLGSETQRQSGGGCSFKHSRPGDCHARFMEPA